MQGVGLGSLAYYGETTLPNDDDGNVMKCGIVLEEDLVRHVPTSKHTNTLCQRTFCSPASTVPVCTRAVYLAQARLQTRDICEPRGAGRVHTGTVAGWHHGAPY